MNSDSAEREIIRNQEEKNHFTFNESNTLLTNSDVRTMDKISSGIINLDELLDGGFVYPSTIYLVGEPGAGKTTFAMQFLFEGAKKGEKGLYFSVVGESAVMILSHLSQYSYFATSLFGEMIEFIDLSNTLAMEGLDKALEAIKKSVETLEPYRVVIDSITPLLLKTSSEDAHRATLYDLFLDMKAWGATTVVLGEVGDKSINIEEYMADAVLKLGFLQKGLDSIRYLKIKKVRGVNHSTMLHNVNISSDGVEITRFPDFDVESIKF